MDGLGLHPAPPSRSPLSARAFGSRVLLGELIGRGGMSRVYRGWIRGSGHEVAVKILRDDLATRPEAVQRFVRERDLLAAVANPHVVRVHDLVVDGDELGIVMDLVPGGHLRRAVPFPCLPAQAAELTVQIADGLAAVHATGVIHRDLKPENVLVDADSSNGSDRVRLRLTDFGISRLVDAAQLTSTAVTGTPGYLAPEVAAGALPTAAADVYALGVVLYELCTGRGPFLADNPLVLILAHTRQEPPRPGRMADPLWALLATMLAKDPAGRPTAAQVAASLRDQLPDLQGQPFCLPPESAPAGDELTAADAVRALPGAPDTVSGVAGEHLAGVQLIRPVSAAGAPGQGAGYLVPSRTEPPRLPDRLDPLDPLDQLSPRGGRRLAVLQGLRSASPLVAVAAAGAVLLAVLAGFGVRTLLTDDAPLPVTTESPAPSAQPTGPPPSTPSASLPQPSPVLRTVVPAPRPKTSTSHPPANSGTTPSRSPSPTPSPAVPTLARTTPTPAEIRSSDGHANLTIGQVSTPAGAVASITVRYSGGQQLVPVDAARTSYETVVEGLRNGTKYAFTVEVCNSLRVCTTSAPLEFTPYGAVDVRRPRATAGGLKVTVSWRSVLRNDNPGTVKCIGKIVGTPSGVDVPSVGDVSPDGGSVTFTGSAGTTYVATESCTVEGLDAGSATSTPLVLTPPLSPSPSLPSGKS